MFGIIQEVYLLYGQEWLIKILFFFGCAATIIAIMITLLINDKPMD